LGCEGGFFYLWLLAEAEPGEGHELAFAVGEGVFGVDGGSHAGCGLVVVLRWVWNEYVLGL
jgi:hypothetical protein